MKKKTLGINNISQRFLKTKQDDIKRRTKLLEAKLKANERSLIELLSTKREPWRYNDLAKALNLSTYTIQELVLVAHRKGIINIWKEEGSNTFVYNLSNGMPNIDRDMVYVLKKAGFNSCRIAAQFGLSRTSIINLFREIDKGKITLTIPVW